MLNNCVVCFVIRICFFCVTKFKCSEKINKLNKKMLSVIFFSISGQVHANRI